MTLPVAPQQHRHASVQASQEALQRTGEEWDGKRNAIPPEPSCDSTEASESIPGCQCWGCSERWRVPIGGWE
jgi:hypothetical protein